MIEIPDPALAGLAAGALSALALGGGLRRSGRGRTRQREEIAVLRSTLDGLRRELDSVREESDAAGRDAAGAAEALTAEVAHLVRQRLPAEATRAAHPHVAVPGPLDPAFEGTPFEDGLQDVLAGVLAAMAQERKRVDAAARAAMRGATRDVQAGLYRLQDQLRSLQQRYDEPELAQVLFALDHENEQSLRRAQVTAVVCGAWVGLAREESHLVEAVTGGQSRLVGYHRVKVSNHLEAGTALVSHAVEPVAIITAELLDNALRHSAPDTDVVVNLERVHHGVAVTVDDAGVGMAADERAWAQAMVAGGDPILLSELGDPPRMGLAAIGQLTRRFDLSVDLSSPSPYGGVRAVLLIRSHLLSHIDPVEQPPAASTPRSTRPAAAPAPADLDAGPGHTDAPADPDAGPGHTDAHARAAAPDADAVRGPAPARRTDPGRAAEPARGRAPGPYALSGDPHAADPHGTGPHGTDPREADPHVADPRQADPYRAGSRGADPHPTGGHPTGGHPAGENGTGEHRAGGRDAGDAEVLPQRRRRPRRSGTASAPTAAADPLPPARSPEEAAAALGALQSGTAAARSATDPQDAPAAGRAAARQAAPGPERTLDRVPAAAPDSAGDHASAPELERTLDRVPAAAPDSAGDHASAPGPDRAAPHVPAAAPDRAGPPAPADAPGAAPDRAADPADRPPDRRPARTPVPADDRAAPAPTPDPAAGSAVRPAADTEGSDPR